MEFHEKLQSLRKEKGLTQEQLAADLFVSRTAVSKWESGRGYPSIESLKDISVYFNVTVDELLSTQKMLTIAEKENKENITNAYELFFAVADLLSVLLIILPLYPDKAEDFVYSVSLFNYTESSAFNIVLFFAVSVLLFLSGVLKLLMMKIKNKTKVRCITVISMAIGVFAVVFFALAGEVYAVTIVFLLFLIKGVILLKLKEY